jgi:hypothetical protein
MKAKKAVKKLMKVEALLSNISELYAAKHSRVRDLLDAAKDSVVRAKDAVKVQVSRSVKHRPLKPKPQRSTAKRRKRPPVATSGGAKRKGVQAVAVRRLSQTA